MSCCCAPTKNKKVLAFVEEMKNLCTPDKVVFCDGSQEEYDRLCEEMVAVGVFTKLNQDKRPGCYLARSHASDVARVEDRTYICCPKKEEAGPTCNWEDPDKMKEVMRGLYKGCMKGRTMYVIPFSMGPIGSPVAQIGVEISDSPYVVVNMKIMTRMGSAVWQSLGDEGTFIPCMHSIGSPLELGQADSTWPCAPIEKKYICHFTQTNEIWSYGSGYGGNALLGKKCFALRIASSLARSEGWMAEHMLIMKVTNPAGKSYHVCAAFPSACGKTNLAMMQPNLPGWKVETLGDDIAWIRIGTDGRLYAVNPEAGFFGVAPGTSMQSNPNAMYSVEKNTIFTNVALTEDGDIWWEDMGVDAPDAVINWKGEKVNAITNEKGKKCFAEKAAHPNARFTAPAINCPALASTWDDPVGVPIDAILFGGRRPSTIPLVNEATDWTHAVFMGSAAGSETTAANIGAVGQLRRDPMAMLPFFSYNTAEYFTHWLTMAIRTSPCKLPKVFFTNWFRKDDGSFMWPGYGDNIRVLKWITERIEGTAQFVKTPIGIMPTVEALDLEGNDVFGGPICKDKIAKILTVDVDGWKAEIDSVEESYAKFGSRVPYALKAKLDEIRAELAK